MADGGMSGSNMSPEQYRDFKASVLRELRETVKDTTVDYLDKHLDKHLDLGADGTGLGTEVTEHDSSLNQFNINLPTGTSATLYADLLYWGDLVPYGVLNEGLNVSYFGASINVATNVVPTATNSITPAQFATAGLGWQPPTWLAAPTGTNGFSGLSQGQTYQLSLMYMQQSVALFSNLNITSGENSQQAPVIGSVALVAQHVNAWGERKQNGTPLSDAIAAAQYRQNQIVIMLNCTMSLFDWINVTTQTPTGTNALTFSVIFHSRAKEAKGATFHAKASKALQLKGSGALGMARKG